MQKVKQEFGVSEYLARKRHSFSSWPITSLLFIYKAGDSRSNLHIALEHYQEDVIKNPRNEMEVSITDLMAFYRNKFPDATVLPKMHNT